MTDKRLKVQLCFVEFIKLKINTLNVRQFSAKSANGQLPILCVIFLLFELTCFNRLVLDNCLYDNKANVFIKTLKHANDMSIKFKRPQIIWSKNIWLTNILPTDI